MNEPLSISELSVVIPTMGRETLIETLESLIATHHFEQLQVFVAGKVPEGVVGDQLQAMVDRYPGIHHLPVSYVVGDSSEKKNAGWRESKTELVAFLDDDVSVAPDWPTCIVAAFENPEVGLVSGPSLVPDDISLFARMAGVVLQSKAAGYVSERYVKGQTSN